MNKTVCSICGKVIEYNTKKPKTCKACKEAKKTLQKPKNKSKNTHKTKWKAETRLFEILDVLLPSCQYCINGYYSWLQSPSGAPLQLDWYSMELGLAFEYEGAQHYTYSKYFHKTKKAFNYLQECDKAKEKQCEMEGVVLVKIRYDTDLTLRNVAIALKKSNEALYNILLKDKMLNLTQEDIEAIAKM